MLAGGYSKHYQTMEKSHIQTLKDIVEIDKSDAIARARRLSQETNKRRKQQIQKRKSEAQREEKRREDILARRREEQRKATERFQRANIPISRPGSRRSSPKRTNIDDALRLIRGNSYISRQNSASSVRSNLGRTSPRAFSSNNYKHEPTNMNNILHSSGPHRPLSPKERADNHAREHAQMMDRSFRNMANSRSLFETQLEHHQQLLLEDQKKALHQFNKAIMNEIELDQTIQGAVDIDTEMVRTESLSSVDSLDEPVVEENPVDDQDKTLSSQTAVPASADQTPFTSMARVALSVTDKPSDASKNKQQLTTSDQHNTTVVQKHVPRTATQSRILEEVTRFENCGDIDSPTSLNSSSASSFLSNQVNPNTGGSYGLTYQTGPHMLHSYNSKIVHSGGNVASAPRTNQSSSQNIQQYVSSTISQGSSSLALSSVANQNCSSNKFILSQVNIPQNSPTSDQIGKINKLFSETPVSTHYSSILAAHSSPVVPTSGSATTYVIGPRQLASRDGASNSPLQTREWITSESPSTNSNLQNWQGRSASPTSHPPTEQLQTRHAFPPPSTSVNHYGHIAHPISQRQFVSTNTTSLISVPPAVTTTATTLAWAGNSYRTSVPQVVSKANYSATSLQSSTVNCKTIAHSISSDIHTRTVAATSGKPITCEQAGRTTDVSNRNVPTTHADPFSGSISSGTLGLVNGKLTVLTTAEKYSDTADDGRLFHKPPKPSLKKTSSDIESTSVRSILKRPEVCVMKKAESTGSLNIRDSIEVTRSHLNQRSEEQISILPKKKSVRFSDLNYNESRHVEDQDTEVETDMNRKAPASIKGIQAKPKPRPRPISAKVVNLTRGELPIKGARAVSASVLQHAKDRPKAAAHIITHSIEGAQFLQDLQVNSTAVQQDKKVAVVNNNFMEKVPVQQKAVASQYGGCGVSNGYVDGLRRVEVDVPSVSDFTPSAASVPQMHAVYDENGLRIDRTPTDDEINSLWDKVRTCLDSTPSGTDRKNQYDGSVDPNNKHMAPVSNKYIDGASLGMANATRVAPAYNLGGIQQRAVNNMSSAKQRPTSNGYLRRYGLLQQRRGGMGRTPIVPQQDPVNTGPTVSHQGPQTGTNYQTKEDAVSDSMAAFMVAEKLSAQSATQSQIESALDEARRRQILQVKQPASNPGGPSALSIEERRLLESLERINEKLKINESGYPVRTTSQQVSPPQQNVFVHNIRFEVQALPGQYLSPRPGGFRGHQPYQSQPFRPQSGYIKPTVPSAVEQQRVQSARHYR